MPDCHQELAGNRHDGFGTPQVRFQPLKFFLPVGMMLHSMVGCVHHGPAQISAARLGDPAAEWVIPLSWTGAQPGITHQLFGIGEAGDIADGRQDRDGREHGHSWQLDQAREYAHPGHSSASGILRPARPASGQIRACPGRSAPGTARSSRAAGFPTRCAVREQKGFSGRIKWLRCTMAMQPVLWPWLKGAPSSPCRAIRARRSRTSCGGIHTPVSIPAACSWASARAAFLSVFTWNIRYQRYVRRMDRNDRVNHAAAKYHRTGMCWWSSPAPPHLGT